MNKSLEVHARESQTSAGIDMVEMHNAHHRSDSELACQKMMERITT